MPYVYVAAEKTSQQKLTVEDDGTFQVGSRYSKGISASLLQWRRSWAMLTHRCQQREGKREERCSVFPVPGRLSRPTDRQTERERGKCGGGP